MYNIENYKTYLDKLKGYYDDRDISHGWNHVLQVCKNSLLISQYENITNINKLNIIVICSLGHDIWDHKYVDNSELLKENFRNSLLELKFSVEDIDCIIRIIDSISFSKEYKLRLIGQRFKFNNNDELKLRNVVSDADKLESLGLVCIERMIEYEININKNHSIESHIEHITKHCNEKLYLLIDKNYIKTEYAKKLASVLLNEMKNIVENKVKLQNFIKLYLEKK